MPTTPLASTASWLARACSETLACDEQLVCSEEGGIAATGIILEDGLFPGFYPEATAYPGRGNTLGVQAVSPKILIGSAA